MKKRKMRKDIYKSYEQMNSYEKSIVHNGWYRWGRVNKNNEYTWLINDKQNNKDIINILKRERNERINRNF